MKGKTMLYAVILIAAVSAAALFVLYRPAAEEQPGQQPSGGYANPQLLVEPEWLEMHREDPDVRVIDVRPAPQYQEGHIPGSAGVYYKRFQTPFQGILSVVVSAEEFEAIVGGIGVTPETTVVLYDSFDNLDAALGFWAFEYFGHRDVRLLNGGFERWVSEGRGVDDIEPRFEKTEYAARVREERIADADWILQHLGSSDVAILDVRSPQEYRGEILNTRRGGHIPGAVNVEWSEAMNPDGTFKHGDALSEMYRSVGVTPDREVAVYCQSGHRASHGYFVLRLLGYSEVRVYDRSWLEWGNRSDLPLGE